MLLPYEALMQTQGLSKKDLPSEIQTLIKRIEATRSNVARNPKEDEYGNFIVSKNIEKKISELDSEIVNSTWDWLDEKQKTEMRKSVPNSETQQVETVNQEAPKEETQKDNSKGTIGFFDF
jgi:tRNA U54 and U55 pseudouridine synthase Pus10